MPFTLQIDDTSLLLLTAVIILSLLPRIFSSNPAAHPLLFAKQSETSTVRRAGRSATYRHWSTGSAGHLATRPEQGVDGVPELVKGGEKDGKGKRWIGGTAVDLPRRLEEIERGLAALLDRTETHGQRGGSNRIITCVPTTATTLLPLVLLHLLPTSSSTNTAGTKPTSNTSAKSQNEKHKFQLVTLSQPRFLAHALAKFEDAKIIIVSSEEIQFILDLIPTSLAPSLIKRYLIVLPPSANGTQEHPPIPQDLLKKAEEKGYTLVSFDSVLHDGRPGEVNTAWEEKTEFVQEQQEKSDPEAIHSVVLLPRSTGILDAKNEADDEPQMLTITNANITAGVTAILSLFPATHRPSATASGKKDVFLTSVDLAHPFGLAVAMTALYVGAGLIFVPPSESVHSLSLPSGTPQPTVAFLSPAQLRSLTSRITQKAKSNLLYPIAKRQAQARLRDGSVSRSGWAETAVWRSARSGVADALRCVIVTGEKAGDALSVKDIEEAFIHLAIPVIRTHINPRTTAPVTATHFFDYQLVPYTESGIANEESGTVHSGPPGVNIEIELRGEEVERALGNGGDPRGAMYARGSTVLRSLSTSTEPAEAQPGIPHDVEWVRLSTMALARTNGTFVVL